MPITIHGLSQDLSLDATEEAQSFLVCKDAKGATFRLRVPHDAVQELLAHVYDENSMKKAAEVQEPEDDEELSRLADVEGEDPEQDDFSDGVPSL